MSYTCQSSAHTSSFRPQRAWLEKHGVVKSKTANTRDELLNLMSRNYYGARDTSTSPVLGAENAFLAFSPHGGKRGTDFCCALSSSTAYEYWSDSAIRRWLESRGLAKPTETSTAAESVALPFRCCCCLSFGWSLVAGQRMASLKESRTTDAPTPCLLSRLRQLMADNYWKLRDQAYSAWDESMLKSYLNRNKVEYKADAKKQDLVHLVKDTCAFWRAAT